MNEQKKKRLNLYWATDQFPRGETLLRKKFSYLQKGGKLEKESEKTLGGESREEKPANTQPPGRLDRGRHGKGGKVRGPQGHFRGERES